MNIYKITVREISHIKYEVEANSEEEARDLIGMGDLTPEDQYIIDWDIIEIEEYK